MPLPRLEVFDSTTPGTTEIVTLERSAIEEDRLAAWEQGYRAGWDDAVAAQSEDRQRIGADLARNLQELAFTYQEARTHVLAGLEPLLVGIVGQLLPALARETLAPLVLERLMPMAEDLADQPVHLVLNPVARPAVEALLTGATGLPLRIVEEPTLGEGQVCLRRGAVEARVDLGRAVAEITAAVRRFFNLVEENQDHG